ncbi:hypothetical protein Tco_1225000 [Tanacetum coccineum]
MQKKPHDDGVENKSLSIPERTTQPLVKPQESSIPFLNRSTKEKEEAQQQKFLQNLKQLHINIPFIEALVQMPKYAKYLKSLLTNKSRLEEACTMTTNERCSAILRNKLPAKETNPGSFTIPCQHTCSVSFFFFASTDTFGKTGRFAVLGFGYADVAVVALSFDAGSVVGFRAGMVDTIVSAIFSMTSCGGVPAQSVC